MNENRKITQNLLHDQPSTGIPLSERTGNHIKIIDGSLSGQDTKTSHTIFDSARRGRLSSNYKESSTDIQNILIDNTNSSSIEKRSQTKAFAGIKSDSSIRELLTKYSQNKDESPLKEKEDLSRIPAQQQPQDASDWKLQIYKIETPDLKFHDLPEAYTPSLPPLKVETPPKKQSVTFLEEEKRKSSLERESALKNNSRFESFSLRNQYYHSAEKDRTLQESPKFEMDLDLTPITANNPMSHFQLESFQELDHRKNTVPSLLNGKESNHHFLNDPIFKRDKHAHGFNSDPSPENKTNGMKKGLIEQIRSNNLHQINYKPETRFLTEGDFPRNYESKENDDQKDTLPLSQRTLYSPTSSDKHEKSRKPSLIDKVIEKLLESDFDTSRASFRPNNVKDQTSFKNVQNPATLILSAQNTQRDQIFSETNEIKFLVDEIQPSRKAETLHDNKISPIRVKVDLENIMEEKNLQDKAIQLNESEFGAVVKYPVGYLSVGDLINQSSNQSGTAKKEPVPQSQAADTHKQNFLEMNSSNKTWMHLENEIVDSMRRTHKELSENINVLIFRLKNCLSEKDLDELKQVQTKIQFLNRLDVEFQKNKSSVNQDLQSQSPQVMRNLIQQDWKVDLVPSPAKQNKPSSSSSSLKPKQITMSLSSLLDDQLENKDVDPRPFQNVEIKSTTKKSVSFQKPWEPSLINEAKATSKTEREKQDSFSASKIQNKTVQLRDKIMSNFHERAGSATGRLTQRQDQSTEFQPLFKTDESQNNYSYHQKTSSPQKKPKYSGHDLEVNKPTVESSILTRRDTREKIKSKAESKIADIARGCSTDRPQGLYNLEKHNKTKTPTSQRSSNKIDKSRDRFHLSDKVRKSSLVAKGLHENKVESLYQEILELDQKLAESTKLKETETQENDQELPKPVIHWPEDNYLEKARKKGALRAQKYLKEKNFATSSSSYKASSSSRILTEPAPDTSDMFQPKLDGSFELRLKYTGEAVQKLKSAIKKAV